MIVYAKVTRDEYELPIAIADSVPELAKITGATVNSIYTNITHQKRGQIKNGSYKRIDIGDAEEDESTCLE